MTLYYSLVSGHAWSCCRFQQPYDRPLSVRMLTARTGFRHLGVRDGTLHGLGRPNAFYDQAEDVQFYLRESPGSKITIWDEGRNNRDFTRQQEADTL